MKPKVTAATQLAAFIRSERLSPTEQRNPRSTNLDSMPLDAAIRLMLSEEAAVPGKLLRELRTIEKVIHLIVSAFRSGGRLLYAGAGTSGRLGVLDASECPPTFQTDPELVQGVIAGGRRALWQSIEGAEDDLRQGAKELRARRVTSTDVVVGIAASGTTPFVWGALAEAKKRGAATVLVCFNPHLRIARTLRPKLVLAVDLGPEVLTGSTRLKAGTATKLLLNLFTTLSMVRLGKVIGNLMVDVAPRNSKLRRRAVRIIRELTGAEENSVYAALRQTGWDVRKAARQLSQ